MKRVWSQILQDEEIPEKKTTSSLLIKVYPATHKDIFFKKA